MSEKTIVEDAVKNELADIKKNHSIQPGTPAYEAYLAAGYPDISTVEHAREIIAARDKDHSAYPWDYYQRAKAFEETYSAKPEKWTTSHPPTDNRGRVIEPQGRRVR